MRDHVHREGEGMSLSYVTRVYFHEKIEIALYFSKK